MGRRAYRKTERNIGVAAYRIASNLAVLFDDVGSSMTPELAPQIRTVA
ncbi:hypothetical protein ACKWRH_45880 (plasmid) [Bradyrhizobium sp. Pa8]